jgi:hypothetical protein
MVKLFGILPSTHGTFDGAFWRNTAMPSCVLYAPCHRVFMRYFMMSEFFEHDDRVAICRIEMFL